MTPAASADDDMREMAADDVVVSSLRSLFRTMQCRSLREVESELQGSAEWVVYVHGIGRFAAEGIEIQIGVRGTGLTYPFTVGEVWSYLDDLHAEADAESAYEKLADQIGNIEGFPVWVTVAYDVDAAKVKPRHRRRELQTGAVVQFPHDYPYRTPMSGSKSVADWVVERFERNYPGLEVWVPSPGDPVPPTTSLSDLRNMSLATG